MWNFELRLEADRNVVIWNLNEVYKSKHGSRCLLMFVLMTYIFNVCCLQKCVLKNQKSIKKVLKIKSLCRPWIPQDFVWAKFCWESLITKTDDPEFIKLNFWRHTLWFHIGGNQFCRVGKFGEQQRRSGTTNGFPHDNNQ